ncbi:MAG TPA: hypothetical protein VHO72_13160 [Bacteroidales bacterium]|nr:hypothetical protein [Bacteroidales bacterium]
MKKVKFVFAALFSALLVSSVSASGVVVTDASGVKSSENSLREQIAQVVSSISYEGSAVVSVKFSVDEKAGFSLKEVDGTDKALASKVKAVLAKSSLNVPTSLDGAYLLEIKFVADADLAEATSSDSSNLREVIAESLSSVGAAQGSSVELHFAVKDNSILVKKVEGADKGLAKSISLALENTKIESAKLEGNYQTTVKF